MKFCRHLRLIIIGLSALLGGCATAITDTSNFEVFDSWKVHIAVDEFEGELKPLLVSSVYSLSGRVVGQMHIRGLRISRGKVGLAFTSFYVPGLDSSWPECDYETTKYKVDNAESEYFGTYGHACEMLVINKTMALKFKAGKRVRFTASGHVFEVDLTGFTRAWDYTIQELRNNT